MSDSRKQPFNKDADGGLVFNEKAVREDRAAWLNEATAGHRAGEINPLVAVRRQPDSRPAAIRAECWLCVGGDHDGNATGKIKVCTLSTCALWLLRPYQDAAGRKADRAAAKAGAACPEAGKVLDPVDRLKTKPWSNALAVRAYCWQCQGEGKNQNTRRDVAECSAAKCGLWDVRPWQAGKAAETEAKNLAETDDDETD